MNTQVGKMADMHCHLAWVVLVVMLMGCREEVSPPETDLPWTYQERMSYERDGHVFSTTIVLEGTDQFPHESVRAERYAQVQWAVAQAWFEWYGEDVYSCLGNVHVFVPQTDESFGFWCSTDMPANRMGCTNPAGLHGVQPEFGWLTAIRRDHYEAPTEVLGLDIHIHELLHLAAHCARGDTLDDHPEEVFGLGVNYSVHYLARAFGGVGRGQPGR
jgi:hypothetical protein